MRFKKKKRSKEKGKKENTFCKLKSFFFSCYFFIIPFPLHSKMISMSLNFKSVGCRMHTFSSF